jgi:hypothetical protein
MATSEGAKVAMTIGNASRPCMTTARGWPDRMAGSHNTAVRRYVSTKKATAHMRGKTRPATAPRAVASSESPSLRYACPDQTSDEYLANCQSRAGSRLASEVLHLIEALGERLVSALVVLQPGRARIGHRTHG